MKIQFITTSKINGKFAVAFFADTQQEEQLLFLLREAYEKQGSIVLQALNHNDDRPCQECLSRKRNVDCINTEGIFTQSKPTLQ